MTNAQLLLYCPDVGERPKEMRMKQWIAFACAALAGIVSGAQAEVYPSRPITVIVPFAAGGPTDSLARVLTEPMRAALGQPLIIENVTGATGSLGVARVVQAAPDGYTVSIGNTATHVINGAVFKLKYDVINDLEPVAMLPRTPFLLDARTTIPAKNLKELVAWAKASGKPLVAGTPGVGSIPHVAGILFGELTGVPLSFVPYRGAALSMQDLIAGQIDMMFDQAWNSLAQVRAGTVRAYAVTAPERLASAPDIPTVDEAGVPGLHVTIWNGLWVPKGTPREIVAKLSGAATDALADPMVRQRLADLGLEIPPRDQQTAQALAALQKADAARWWPVIKAAHLKME
jgi:tripartite-type tricarboxylate transporter receptor subunit TctC